MNRKKSLGLMMALLMVFSTFTIVNAVNTTNNVVSCKTDMGPYVCGKGWIDFNKMVWNNDEGDWWEFTWAESGDTVRFNITLTYHKDPLNPNNWALHHIIISDELPDCLEFADNVTIETTGSSPITYIEGTAGNMIIWTFSDYEPMLYDGESLYLEFDASVFESEFIENENIAYVEANECNQYDHEAEDNAWVFIEQEPEPESLFEKKVLDGDVWSEETNVTVGSVVTFSINLTYYGDEYLHNISIIDYLPCCLEYADNANIEPSGVSDDLKTIWWNFTDVLTDGQSIYITFDALVTGTTGCGCDGINTATVDAYDGCLNEPYYAEDDAKVTATCGDPNVPPCWPLINGDETGMVGDTLTFYVKTYDYNEDDVYYWIEWGDETYTGWIGPYESGEQVEVTNSWEQDGIYGVKAKAKDIYEEESLWGNTWTVEITSNEPPSKPTISGDTSGRVEEELTFSVITNDPEEDDVYYWIEWGDETNTGWIGPYPSGVQQEKTHSWSEAGTFNVRAKAKDIYDKESTWSNTHTVVITDVPPPPVNLKIKLKAFSMGRVVARIENVGIDNASDINWTISVKMFRLLRGNVAEENGNIPNLMVGQKTDVSTLKKSVRFRLGTAKVTVRAEVEGQEPTVITQRVLVLGRIVLARPKLLGI